MEVGYDVFYTTSLFGKERTLVGYVTGRDILSALDKFVAQRVDPNEKIEVKAIRRHINGTSTPR